MSSIFSSMMQAFDLASRMEQLRLMEQSTRLSQQRSTLEAQAATLKATVAVRGDGYEVVRQAPVSLGLSAPVELETSKQRDQRSLRLLEMLSLLRP